MRRWLICSLVATSLGGCATPPGNFCDVVRAPISFAAPTAAAVVSTDRTAAERIAAQNAYGSAHCGWGR